MAKAGTATIEVTTVGNQTAATDVGAEALATRFFTAALGTMDLLHVYVVQKLPALQKSGHPLPPSNPGQFRTILESPF